MHALVALVDRHPIVVLLLVALVMGGTVWLLDWCAGRAERADDAARSERIRQRLRAQDLVQRAAENHEHAHRAVERYRRVAAGDDRAARR
ncbi:MAG: hypothetical protein A3H96_11480 [Acidobacteria bacterium RIFCSPLOWO2_02_FULL_67_36]|nr:MAG: hypothetical protein A3H96_11480 [Acidobacteria bacterium RIFCSPLOWO2_02_FULL_67_36]OGA76286.1 MAG: hypothetical protein A3G27_05735 [Betaproteobacteria bacterium RIFCSPLOWO2_12_FULL_66_14]